MRGQSLFDGHAGGVVVLIAQITDTHIKLPGRLAYRRVGHAEDVRG